MDSVAYESVRVQLGSHLDSGEPQRVSRSIPPSAWLCTRHYERKLETKASKVAFRMAKLRALAIRDGDSGITGLARARTVIRTTPKCRTEQTMPVERDMLEWVLGVRKLELQVRRL